MWLATILSHKYKWQQCSRNHPTVTSIPNHPIVGIKLRKTQCRKMQKAEIQVLAKNGTGSKIPTREKSNARSVLRLDIQHQSATIGEILTISRKLINKHKRTMLLEIRIKIRLYMICALHTGRTLYHSILPFWLIPASFLQILKGSLSEEDFFPFRIRRYFRTLTLS